MGTGDGAVEKTKHNPDVENLKSLLKKTTSKKDKKHNRVVFNETKNEFFDADYIILIREECDFEDEEDDGVCTCYQQEMVRLTCCEPDCNCGGVYEELEVENQTPQSPKFAPPIEFVDAVTLSPPEGYKDMELEELAYKQMSRNRAQRMAVCKECSANQEHENEKGDTCQTISDINKPKIDLDDEECEKETIDQSQQTTPTSPNNSDGKEYILESSVDEDQSFEENIKPLPTADSPVSGILKGGKLWRQQSGENPVKTELLKTDSISDEESNTRTVRFIEEEKKDSCKASPENDREVEGKEATKEDEVSPNKQIISDSAVDSTEMTLTFKLGNHVLISNNSLKPNSAVRQLFPCTKALQPKTGQEDDQQYLVTAESLKAFEEAKRSKLPQIIHNTGTTDNIKRVIERNALRRSFVRYEPKSKKNLQKTDNSLVERIKQLTCDIDDVSQDSDDLSARVSPTGEEGSNNLDVNQISNKVKEPRNFSPSSSSTASSNSSSMSSTYKKITDLFGKREKVLENSTQPISYEPKTVQTQTLPDIGGPYNHEMFEKDVNKPNAINDGRKQFLSTLAPLTACVGGVSHPDDHYYHLSNHGGSVISSTGSEYTLDDIDEALVNEENKKITPDVLAGTPASESGDELVVFVQQDANRIERIKKKYENDNNSRKDDDENDDYGFNHRPSVRGIKPRFGSTTEILQQIQNQIQLPPTNANVAWPYYSETNLNRDDDRINKQNAMTQYQNVSDEAKGRGYQYRPASLHDNYQSCSNQNCYKDTYKTQVGVELDCQSFQKYRNNRPLSPPPQELSKTYHQTMVYIPYNHIENYQQPISSTPNPYQANEYYRYNQNQINKKYIEPIYQQKMTYVDDQYSMANGQHKVIAKTPYLNSYQPLLVPSRSESPLMGNYSMARSTQTSVGCISGCSFYQVPSAFRYRDSLRQSYKSDYVNKVQRHSFPAVRPRYNSGDASEHAYVDEGGMQHVNHLNGYYNYLPTKESPANSPTKARYIERGVPEGAASVSPQDSVNLQSTSTNTSPTSISHTTSKPLFYAMNV